MATSLRDIRRQIKSITGTKKTTQAMQMVSASKMQKAQKANTRTRDYTELAWKIIKNIPARNTITNHPFLEKRPTKNIACLLVTSNRGMCGSLNSQIIKKFAQFVKENEKENISIITLGNKGKQFVAKTLKNNLIADFELKDSVLDFEETRNISKFMVKNFLEKKFDRVYIFFNNFQSTLVQVPTARQILPIADIEKVEEYQLGKDIKDEIENNKKNLVEYKFEPDQKAVLDILLPQVIETQIYQLILEANASDHSARMIAMKNATDNADDLISDLTLTYNSLRQAAITREISEITSGAEALNEK